jgi:hypothetical protein
MKRIKKFGPRYGFKRFVEGGPTDYASSGSAGGSNVSFGEAFKAARKQGLGTFTWRGKKYTTETKEEKDKKSLGEVEIKSKRPDFTEIYERDTVTDKTGAGQRGPSARRSGMKTYTVSANKPSAAEEDVGGRRRFMAPGARREREKERSEVMNFRKGGSVKSSASRRADGIAKKGKTRGKYI